MLERCRLQQGLIHWCAFAGFIRHPSFGPDLLPASFMMRILESLNSQDAAPTDLRERLLSTAFAWLETTDDDVLHHVLPVKELTSVADKAGRIALKLDFATLGTLYGQTPRGFHRLMTLDSFLPSLTALEGLLKVDRYVNICIFVLLQLHQETMMIH
jgi:hypothetical protein